MPGFVISGSSSSKNVIEATLDGEKVFELKSTSVLTIEENLVTLLELVGLIFPINIITVRIINKLE